MCASAVDGQIGYVVDVIVICVLYREAVSYAYLSKHVADESGIVCDVGTIECTMGIYVRRMANISDMNVQGTGIAAMDRAP